MSTVRFRMDPTFHIPRHEVTDPQDEVLADWIVNDLEAYFGAVLDALAMADDVAHGKPPFDEWGSESYEVSFTPAILHIRQCWPRGREAEYSADVACRVLEEYWRFLAAQPEKIAVREYRPDLLRWQADLLWWEEKWSRTHPYRGRLF